MFHSNVPRFHEPYFYLFLSLFVTLNSEVVSAVKRYHADKFSYDAYEGQRLVSMGLLLNAKIMSCTQPLLLYVAQSKVRGLATSFVLCTVKNKVFGNWLSTAPCPLKKAFVYLFFQIFLQ